MSTDDTKEGTKEGTKTPKAHPKARPKQPNGSRSKFGGGDYKSKIVPIVAVGASAGGLEPIELFFDSMPPSTGCAFVIIQHLSPDFRSLMDELLAPHSSMKIHRVRDGMEIEPNSIYLNSPRSVMTIDGNRLRVENIVIKDNTVNLPIDLFFESLAANRGENAIGLVFSGTGSDGTRGAESIKKSGGKVLVQDPATTRFDGMPKSAITHGHHEMVAAPGELAGLVVKLLNNESIDMSSFANREPIKEPLQDLLSMLKHRYGTDFHQYKEATVKRRIERRAHINRITEINDYRDLLNTDELELQDLYADLLIEVTEFFRDTPAFDIIRNQVLPRLMQDLTDGAPFRVWVPGCASGEEAYSLAILLKEQARVMGLQLQFKILATDIHIRSMSKASAGIYDESSLKGVPSDLRARYFDISDGDAQVKPIIRNMVFFSTHDVMRDPPFTRIDIVSCRNLLIYLKDEAQENVLNLLHFSLRKDGYLFLGPSEHIGKISHEFDIISEKWRIFKKRRDIKLLPAESIFQNKNISEKIPVSNLNSKITHQPLEVAMGNERLISFKRAQRAALEEIVAEFAPPGFLLTEDGTVVHIFGSAGSLLPMQSGSFSRNIVDLIRPDLKVIVTAALDQTKNREFSEFRRIAYIKESEESSISFEVLLRRIALADETQRFVLLSIFEIKKPIDELSVTPPVVKEFLSDESSEALRQRILILEHSLSSSEDSLQSTIEELETSNEELQSTNEELMSTNEELQSTNEELHSVNEELYTVSAEHQRKNHELTERDNDLDTLLNLSKIGTVHLDENLNLLRFTNGARSVFNIMAQDVGRPFKHITLCTSEKEVFPLVEDVFAKQVTHDIQLAVDDSMFLLRILPYHREEDLNNGVLITVVDITDLQSVKSELAHLNIEYKDIVDSTDSIIVRWDAETNKILYCNDRFADRWGTTPQLAVGLNIVTMRQPDERKLFLESLREITIEKGISGVVTSTDSEGRRRSARFNTRGISLTGEKIDQYQSTGVDCTDELQYQNGVDKLSSVFSDVSLSPSEKLDAILSAGLEYFELDIAVISEIVGDTSTVHSIVSKVPTDGKPGVVRKLSETMCDIFISNAAYFSIDDIVHSDVKEHACYKASKIESFIGASVQTVNGPFGTVTFSSATKRGRPYSVSEESFSLLISGWVGYLLGNVEQIGFMANQNDYYQSLFKSVPAMLFLCDKEGLILSASDRFTEQIGTTGDRMPGKPCLELFEPQDSQKISTAILTGFESELPAKLLQRNKAPLEVELSVNVKPIGTLEGIRIVIIDDVSSRNTASREASEKNRRLEVANESLNQFAFIASHDLQEPLRKIQQFSSFLEEDLGDALNKDGRYHINVIVEASQRMSTLIHDLLSFSGTSRLEARLEAVKLEPLVSEVLESLELPEDKPTINVDCKEHPVFQANKLMLNQMLVNLLSNSIKYRVADRPLVISIVTKIKNGIGTIEVSDNGIGFDMQFAKKIFEPFNRLHNTKQYKGNGIGLAICQTVCEKHGWSISAEGEPNKGSKFIITMNDERD